MRRLIEATIAHEEDLTELVCRILERLRATGELAPSRGAADELHSLLPQERSERQGQVS